MKELAQKYKRQTASRYLPVGKEEITSALQSMITFQIRRAFIST